MLPLPARFSQKHTAALALRNGGYPMATETLKKTAAATLDAVETPTDAAQSETRNNEPNVSVYLPPLEVDTTSGKVDQSVTVVINGKIWRIQRGETVSVPASVYTVLKESGRFPKNV